MRVFSRYSPVISLLGFAGTQPDNAMKTIKLVATAALLAATLSGSSTAAAPLYRLVASIPLGPGERWDYVTYSDGRAYVAHGDHLSVVDVDKGTLLGSVTGFPGGTHGIAVVPGGTTAYTDDGEAGTATSFDAATFKTGSAVKTAPDADGMVYDPASGHIFVINGDSGSITVIDPKTNAAIATITVGAGLEASIPDGHGKLFVDGAEKKDLDTATNTVASHFPMPGCERPHGIAVDAETHRVFATCVNKVMTVVNADTGATVATLPIDAYSDGAAFDPKRKWALSSNGDGTVTVVAEKDADHFEVLGNQPTQMSARTIAIDPATGRIFLPAADIAKIDPPTAAGGRPHVTYTPGSAKLLVYTPN